MLAVKVSRVLRVFVVMALAIGLVPSLVHGAQLSLSWTDNSGGQASFNVLRSTGTTGTFTVIAQQPPGTNAYIDTTVTAGATYCYLVQAFTSASASDYSNEACGTPSSSDFSVTVVESGTGQGTTTSSPTGISCGTVCSAAYPAGTVVTLSASPATGSAFTGWSGGCTGTGSCAVAANGAVTVGATFATLPGYTLTVSTKGPGSVRSNPGGISCGSTCSASYASGTVVTLTAVPSRGATFIGWSGGGCSGTASCTVTINQNTSVSATFSKGGKK